MTGPRSPKRSGAGGTRRRRALPISWTDRALSDLDNIGDYITRESEAAAHRGVNRLVAAAEQAAPAPLAGRRVPELGRDDIREILLPTYRIVYLVTNERLVVLTLFEGHRLFPSDIHPPRREEV